MFSFRVRGALSAAALMVSAGTASADVTPAQVWNAVRMQMESMGYALDVKTINETPDSIVLGDVTYTLDLPQGGSAKAVIHGMQFTTDGNGGVDSDASHLTMDLDITNPDNKTIAMVLTFAAPGQSAHYTGVPERIQSSFDWPLARLALSSLVVDGQPVDFTGTMTLNGTKGSYTYVIPKDGSTAPTIESDMTIARIDLDGTGKNLGGASGQEPGDVRITGSVQDVAASGSGQDMKMMMGGLPKGGNSRVTYGATELSADLKGPKGEMQLGMTTTSGFAQSSFENGHMVYGSGNTGLELSASGPMIPFSGTLFKLGSTQGNIDIPLDGSEDPQQFALSISFDGIELAKSIWAMFDPQETLSRDPATFSLDLSGEAVVPDGLRQVFEHPETAQSKLGDLRSIALSGLVMRAVGAELTAAGDATFTPPSPLPVGSIDVHAKNITSVLQKLSALGLVDPSSAGMAQMMLGMYAKPGDGPDTWDSHIEMTEQGGVLVNGQPMQ